MQRALLVDRNYMALAIIPWQKVVKLLVKGKAEPVYADISDIMSVGTGSNMFSIPSVIRLVVTIPWRAPRSRMKFSRKNIMVRDDNLCQYCGIKLGKTGGTIDHVIPRAKGGQTSYTNCVAACKACNNHKADRTPEAVGLKLKSKPKKPTFMVIYKHYLVKHYHKEWADYIIGYAA